MEAVRIAQGDSAAGQVLFEASFPFSFSFTHKREFSYLSKVEQSLSKWKGKMSEHLFGNVFVEKCVRLRWLGVEIAEHPVRGASRLNERKRNKLC